MNYQGLGGYPPHYGVSGGYGQPMMQQPNFQSPQMGYPQYMIPSPYGVPGQMMPQQNYGSPISMPNHSGVQQQLQMGGQPSQPMGSQLAQMGGQPLQPMGSQLAQMGGQPPQPMGSQLAQMGGQPPMGSQLAQMGGQPPMGSQLAQMGGQPPQMGGQPPMGSQLAQMGGQPPQMGIPPTQTISQVPQFTSSSSPNSTEIYVLNREHLLDFVQRNDPAASFDSEVQDLVTLCAEEFIQSVTEIAAKLAKHRKSNTLEPKDLQLHLEKEWNIRIPGFASHEATEPMPKSSAADLQRRESVRRATKK